MKKIPLILIAVVSLFFISMLHGEARLRNVYVELKNNDPFLGVIGHVRYLENIPKPHDILPSEKKLIFSNSPELPLEGLSLWLYFSVHYENEAKSKYFETHDQKLNRINPQQLLKIGPHSYKINQKIEVIDKEKNLIDLIFRIE